MDNCSNKTIPKLRDNNNLLSCNWLTHRFLPNAVNYIRPFQFIFEGTDYNLSLRKKYPMKK